MSATVAVTATAPTFATIFGTPVLFFPVPTPWPSSAGCEKYVYRQADAGTILAWDPVYPQIMGPVSQNCWLPQQSSWWFQESTANPSTAMGPTFVCPQSFSAVHSTVLDSNPAAQTQYTYCCPPQFTLGAILPQDVRSVIQCTSTASTGNTLSFQSMVWVTDTVASTSKLTNSPTTTVVVSSAATIYAPAVNGYNIKLQRDASDTSTGTSTGSTTGSASNTATSLPGGDGNGNGNGTGVSTQPGSSGLSPGGIAGAVIGGIFGLALLAAIAFLIWRRRRRSAVPVPELPVGGQPPELGETGHVDATKYYYGSPPEHAVAEMPPKTTRHELPTLEQRFELPTGNN